MRVIFLDFDGVLNSHDWWDRRGADAQPSDGSSDLDVTCPRCGWVERCRWEFDPAAVARLNEATRGDARIVVSSSWRHGRSVDDLRVILGGIGVAAEVFDKTVDYVPTGVAEELASRYEVRHAERGAEIAEWLSRHEGVVDAYAIVDDGSDAGVGHDGHFVKTEFSRGLLDEHVAALQAILFHGEPSTSTRPR